MRIGLDGRLYRSATGGIGRYSRELIKYLLELDTENQYILFLTPADAAECTVSAKNLKKVVTNIAHFSVAEQLRLPALLAREQLDLMHFLNFNHPIFYRGRFVATVHDLTMNFFPVGRQRNPILRLPYLAVMRHTAAAAAVVVPTATVKHDVERYLNIEERRIRVIHEGASIPEKPLTAVNSSKILADLRITKPYLLFVSQWRPHKGIGVLIEAFNQIKKSQDIQLVLTGKPNAQFPEVPAAIEASPYRQDIITPGFVSDEVLDILYDKATLFVFPSWYEGFGLPPLEAMARGVPVASSDSSVMPEVLGDAAVYFNAKDPVAMSAVLTETLANDALLADLKKQGKIQARHYSWRQMAVETLALYKELCK